MTDRLALLQSFGLSENQSRVYLALLDYPSVGAGELAKSAGVARNRLYEVLDELNVMGLTDIILEEPRKYRARPLEGYVERRVESLAAHIHEIEERRAHLAAFRPRPLVANSSDDAGTTQVLLGRGTVAEQIDRLLARAERSVLAMGSLGGSGRVARHLMGAGLAGRDVKVLLPRGASVPHEPLAAAFPGALRLFDAPLGAILFVVDEREMLLVHPMPDDDRMTQGRDYALRSDNPVFVRDFVTLARAAAWGPVAQREAASA